MEEDAQLAYVVAVPKSKQMNGLRIDRLVGQAPPEARQRLSAGLGAKGERFYDWAAARLPAAAQSRSRGADPAAVGAGPPQHQQARRDRLLPRLWAGTGTSCSPCSPTLSLR
jgi:hypothetical protein